MRAVAIVVCLMLVIGCGEPVDEGRAARDGPDAPDVCEAARQAGDLGQIASVAPLDGGRQAPATSWVDFEDLHELAWASHLIVRGRVTADCRTAEGSGNEPQSIPDYEMQMLVSIDAVYRGEPRASILVPRTSDGYSNDLSLSFRTGDEVILFLSEPENGGAWPVGGPQGHWHVVGDRAVPYGGMFPELPVALFPQAIATSLQQDPPPQVDYFPSLDAAPAGPALPVDRTPPLACDGTVPVTAGNQLATVYTEVSPTHEMYRSTVSYLYDRVVWEVQATYDTPPSSDDPAIRAFYTLLRSIRHQSP